MDPENCRPPPYREVKRGSKQDRTKDVSSYRTKLQLPRNIIGTMGAFFTPVCNNKKLFPENLAGSF